MIEKLHFAADALEHELDDGSHPAQLSRVKRVLGKSRELLQYADDVRTLENRRTMPVTNSRAGTNTIGFVPRHRAPSKV